MGDVGCLFVALSGPLRATTFLLRVKFLNGLAKGCRCTILETARGYRQSSGGSSSQSQFLGVRVAVSYF